MKRYKYDNIKSITDFVDWIIHEIPNINYNNKEYISLLYNIFIRSNSCKLKNIRLEISKYITSLRHGKGASIISIEYWKSLGWNNIEEIKNKISILQKKRSPICIEYYGGDTNSKSKISELQSHRSKKIYEKYSKKELSEKSVFGKQCWINRGYSEEDAIKEYRKRNGSCRECYSSDEEYKEAMIRNSNRVKEHIHKFPEKYFREHSYVSNEEIDFFNNISKFIHDIKHIGFVINVKNSDVIKNQNAIISDGYIKCEDGVILIEYDGSYWHDEKKDEERDNEIFKIRPDIIGVIRVGDRKYHSNKIEDIIDLLVYAIENIKSKKSNRELIY